MSIIGATRKDIAGARRGGLSRASEDVVCQHLRLARRAGRAQSALAAAASLRVFRRGNINFTVHDELDRRFELFGDRRRNVAHWDDPMVDAAEYPEVIEFARILASPHWRRLALSDALTDQRRFGAEVRRERWRTSNGRRQAGHSMRCSGPLQRPAPSPGGCLDWYAVSCRS